MIWIILAAGAIAVAFCLRVMYGVSRELRDLHERHPWMK